MPTTINPVVHYRDLDAGARFLVEAFGFVQHAAHKDDDGSIQYVELSLNGAPLGLGPHTSSMFDPARPSSTSPSMRSTACTNERWPPVPRFSLTPTAQDYGSRDFVAEDHEGHVWCFGTFNPTAEPGQPSS